MWMWIVTLQLEVLELEVEEILNVGVDNHTWQGTWLAGKLQLGLLYMVQVQVSVASGVDKVACLETSYLSHHLQQECIAGDVEWYTKEGVGRALIEL